jgi:hypothetical protein
MTTLDLTEEELQQVKNTIDSPTGFVVVEFFKYGTSLKSRQIFDDSKKAKTYASSLSQFNHVGAIRSYIYKSLTLKHTEYCILTDFTYKCQEPLLSVSYEHSILSYNNEHYIIVPMDIYLSRLRNSNTLSK